MRMISAALAAVCLAVGGCGENKAEDGRLMTWEDLTSRPLPQPSTTVRYREGDAGVIDLWLPPGEGPHPVVVMIHGGCWQKAIADRTLMNYAAEDLRQRGFAVWNIEYRGVDEEGGGYPGTFTDVGDAIDALASADPAWNLDIANAVAFGHSAGGHLAAWASMRGNIGPESALFDADPLPLNSVIISGGLPDLATARPVTLESCLAAIMDKLTGPPSEERPDVLADTSPIEMLPPAAPQISVNGELDRIAPPVLGRAYTDRVTEAGGSALYYQVPAAGHVELISPGTTAFETEAILIESAFDSSDETASGDAQ